MVASDITRQFRDAVSHIPLGTLVKDEYLSLFEAVGALEIGDPKMDSGSLLDGESLNEQFDPAHAILPEEMLWIMDKILALMVAWLLGYPLSQTLFTSVHVERILWPEPRTLQEASFTRTDDATEGTSIYNNILRAYCLITIKNCDLVLNLVTSQHFYEEEDLTTQLFNRDLLHRFTSDEILEYAEGLFTKATSAPMPIPVHLWDCLEARFQFQKLLLSLLTAHSRCRSCETEHFQNMQECLRAVEQSAAQGKPAPDAFSTKIQRRLASTVPPRPMITTAIDQVWPFWSSFLEDCQYVFAAHQAINSQDMLLVYQNFACRSPAPSVYPRALLQSFLNVDGLVIGKYLPSQLVDEDLKSLTAPVPLQIDKISMTHSERESQRSLDERIGNLLHAFTSRSEHTFVNVYRTFALNPCRIRRTLCHAIIEWDRLQEEAQDIDTQLHDLVREEQVRYPVNGPRTNSFSLSSWVYHHKLSMMRLIVETGFEQDIYSPHELSAMYWYLAQLADTHLGHLERISHFVKLKERKGEYERHVHESSAAVARLYREYAHTKATQLLAQTLHGIFTILQRNGTFVSPSPVYSTDEMRYEIRMRPFAQVAIPELSPYSEFKKETEVDMLSTQQLLTITIQNSRAARKAWEEVSKTKWTDSTNISKTRGLRMVHEVWASEVEVALQAATASNLCCATLQAALIDNQTNIRLSSNTLLPSVNGDGGRSRRWIVPYWTNL